MARRLKKRKLNIDEEESVDLLENESTETESESESPFESQEKSEIIDLNEKDNKTEQKVKVDFTNQKFIDDLVSKKTKKVEDDSEGENEFKGKSKSDIEEEIKNAEDGSEDWKPEDFYNAADMIITMLDSFLANMLRMYAKDTSDSAYSLPERKRKMLVKQLGAILTKYQAKFKVEFLFLLSLIFLYAAPVLAARSRRKKILKYNEDKKKSETTGEPIPETEDEYVLEKTDNIIEPEVLQDEVVSTDIDLIMPPDLKRGRGRGRKGF